MADETVPPGYPPVITPAQRYRARHPERVKASLAAYRERHPERAKEAQDRYRERHSEEVKERRAAYQQRHPERVKAAQDRYRERHPERRKATQEAQEAKRREKRRAKKAAALAEKMQGIIPSDYPPTITRGEAKSLGLTRYFTCEPCKHGHIAERRVSTTACLECAKRFEAAYKKRNPEETSKRNAEWRARNRSKCVVASTKWQKANWEKTKAARTDYRERNSERIAARAAEWQKANADKCAANCRNRKARKRAAEGRHTADDIQRIYDAQNGKCACCKTKVGKKYHVDHIIALSKGGSNAARNLQILCGSCNISKRDKDPVEFMRSRGFLL